MSLDHNKAMSKSSLNAVGAISRAKRGSFDLSCTSGKAALQLTHLLFARSAEFLPAKRTSSDPPLSHLAQQTALQFSLAVVQS